MACLRLRNRDSVVLDLWKECSSGKPLQDGLKQSKKGERDKGRYGLRSSLGLVCCIGEALDLSALKS